jgi:hypothetical protein
LPSSVNRVRPLLLGCLATGALALVACGGDDAATTTGSTTTTTRAVADPGSGRCSSIEEVAVELGGQHLDDEFVAADYPTNPPTGGDHNPIPLEAANFYDDPPRLGEAVHLLEHGAVIGWTNDLPAADQKAVEEAFNEVFQEGYYQLAVVENPELDVPFALSAWGAMQKCGKVDTSIIRPFVEEWYASPKTAEGGLACQGPARGLPNC